MTSNKQLTAKQVEALTAQGRHSVGDGLYLEIDAAGGKRWQLRYQLKGKRTNVGLGAYDKKTNTLAMARQKVMESKQLIHKGIHPTEQKRVQKEAGLELERTRKAEQSAKKNTFAVVAAELIDRRKSGWRNAKHAQQWTNTLATYAFPVFGDKPVAEVDLKDIRRCLDPIWESKTETASRVRQRIETVLNYAATNGLRETGYNPAQWRGICENIYISAETLKHKRAIDAGSDGHFSALIYSELPEFYSQLTGIAGLGAMALRLTILTAARTNPVRFAKWDEIDLDKSLWTAPAAKMKTGESLRVALSESAVELIENLPRLAEFVFPGTKEGKPISNGAMLAVLKRMGRTDITVHGFRSTFRDWVGEETSFNTNLAEHALGHGVGNQVERAYARGDQLEKRRVLMEEWGAFVTSGIQG